MIAKRILIADDEAQVRELLSLVLSSQGYEVFTASNGDQLVRMAQDHMPDLLLVDLMMPQLDGYEAIRQLRNDTRTAHLPMIILTARATPNDVVTGFESGADDYITKPFNTDELLARIKSHLRRAAQRPVHNPLTGLAGNILLTEELKYRVKRNDPFALLHIDLNNFKSFNDTYGFARGDRVIKLVADILTECVAVYGSGNDFIGHIGGDDFVVITVPDVVEPLCTQIMHEFDTRVRWLYDPADLARGYLESADRQGVQRHFPIISISIGVVTNLYRSFADHEEVSRVAAEMKHFAKLRPGSYYEIDRRGSTLLPVEPDRRGSELPALLLITPDADLTARFEAVQQAGDFRLLPVPDLLSAQALLARETQFTLVVADIQLAGPDLDAFCALLASPDSTTRLLIVGQTTAAHELARRCSAAGLLDRSVTVDVLRNRLAALLT